MRIRNGRHRRCEDVRNGNAGTPVGSVAAVTDGSCRNHHISGRPGEIRTCPSKENVSVRHRVAQHDVCAFNGVFGGSGHSHFTAYGFAADGVDDGLPIGSQGNVTERAGRDTHAAVCSLDSRRRPAQELIASAGRIAEDDLTAFNIVRARIGRIVLSAAQLVGDGVVHGLPSRIQRHAALGNIFVDLNIVGSAA